MVQGKALDLGHAAHVDLELVIPIEDTQTGQVAVDGSWLQWLMGSAREMLSGEMDSYRLIDVAAMALAFGKMPHFLTYEERKTEWGLEIYNAGWRSGHCAMVWYWQASNDMMFFGGWRKFGAGNYIARDVVNFMASWLNAVKRGRGGE